MKKVQYNNPFKMGKMKNPGIGCKESKERRTEKLKLKRKPL